MAGTAYPTEPIARADGTTKALFTIVVTNYIPAGAGTTVVTIAVQHRNFDDTAWTVAGTFAAIIADGTVNLTLAGLKQLIRFNCTVTATNSYEGAHVFIADPQWLVD
jgi:hypothetical protein